MVVQMWFTTTSLTVSVDRGCKWVNELGYLQIPVSAAHFSSDRRYLEKKLRQFKSVNMAKRLSLACMEAVRRGESTNIYDW